MHQTETQIRLPSDRTSRVADRAGRPSSAELADSDRFPSYSFNTGWDGDDIELGWIDADIVAPWRAR